MRKSYVRPVQHSLPLLAQMRSADRVQKCLLFEVDRTYRGHHESDAFDPKADVAEQFDSGQLANPARQPNGGPLRMAQDSLAG
jgi:hypothetical protein